MCVCPPDSLRISIAEWKKSENRKTWGYLELLSPLAKYVLLMCSVLKVEFIETTFNEPSLTDKQCLSLQVSIGQLYTTQMTIVERVGA